MSDDAQTIQSAIQLIEIGGRVTMLLGGFMKNLGLPVLKGGVKGLGKIMQVGGALIYGAFKEKNTLKDLVAEKGNDIVFFEVSSEQREVLKDMEKQMKAYGITFARMPDLCGGDGRTQYAFSPKDAVRFRMFLRNQAERKKDHPDLPEVKIISAEDYANTGYDSSDNPTPELDEIMKSAEEEIRKEREAQQKAKNAGAPEMSPGPEAKTCRGLDEAVDRDTDRELREHDFFIADADAPGNYIHCRPQTEKFNGRDYIRTYYDIYRDGRLVYQADDGRFEGRSRTYWAEVKQKMMEESGISGKCYRFRSREGFDKWKAGAGRGGNYTAQDEFFRTYEQQAGPGFVKRIDAENLIKTTKDGHLLVDVPEMPGRCLLIDRDSVIRQGYLHHKGARDNCFFVRFREDGRYLLMDKKTGNKAFISHERIKTLWRMGSLKRKARELGNRYDSLAKSRTRTRPEMAKELSGELGDVLSNAAKVKKRA